MDVGFYKPLAQPATGGADRTGPPRWSGSRPRCAHRSRSRPHEVEQAARDNALDSLHGGRGRGRASRWWPSTTSWSSRASSPARAWSIPAAPTCAREGARRRRPARRRARRRGPRAPGRDDGDHRAHLPGRRARPRRGRRGQPAARRTAGGPSSSCGPPWPGAASRWLGPSPTGAELSWPRLRDIVAGLDVTVLNDGDQDRRVKSVIVAAQAVPGRPAAARGGPAGDRAGRPATR